MADESPKPPDPRVPSSYPGMQDALARYQRNFADDRQGLRQDIANSIEQSGRSAEKPVSDHPPPETPTHAARALIGWFAGGLAFQSVETIHDGLWPSLGYGLGAIAVAIFDYKLPAILARSPRLTKSLNDVAADARWWVGIGIASLLIIAASPYIEQHRWPFAWQFETSPPHSAVNGREPLIPPDGIMTGSQAAKELQDLRAQIDELKRQNEALRIAPPQPSQSAIGPVGPIKWNLNGQFLVASGGGPGGTINNVMLSGVSTAPVRIKEAYAISGLTGHRKELVANVQYRGYYPVDKVDIPADAPIFLTLVWQPPLSISDFLDQWGEFSVTVIYGETTFTHEFSEEFVRNQLRQVFPDAFGPHMTPRDSK